MLIIAFARQASGMLETNQMDILTLPAGTVRRMDVQSTNVLNIKQEGIFKAKQNRIGTNSGSKALSNYN